MANHVSAVQTAIDKLTKEQALRAIGLIFNEKGVKDILGYYTIGSMMDEQDPEEKAELQGYLKNMRLAVKLTK